MFRLIPSFLLLPVGLLLLSACASNSPPGEELEMPVFPPAPNEARFFYERSLLSSADVEIESGESQFQRMITGVSRSGIGMGKPFGVTVHKGRVFVSDTLKRLVFAFDIREAKFIEIGTDGPGELVKPMGLDVDLNGNLFVCDASLKQVLVYDRDGNFKRRLGEPEMFDRPAGLTVNPNGSRLYVVDTGGVTSNRHRVLVFDAWTGSLLHTISKRGQAEGELNLPRDATIDNEGNLYVVDGGNFRVQVFTPEGEFVRSFGSIGRQSGQFSRPKGIGVDQQGNVYVVDTAFGNFQIFNSEGQLLMAVGSRNSSAGPARFMLPAGLAIDEDGRVYMVDQYFRKVDIFRPADISAEQGWLVHDPSLQP
jgi:DNA-binding beta-propeller fold protein YncE